MPTMDDAFGGEQDGALNAVFQFADVAGPMISNHHIDGGGADPTDVFIHTLGVCFHEVIGEKQDIIFTIA